MRRFSGRAAVEAHHKRVYQPAAVLAPAEAVAAEMVAGADVRCPLLLAPAWQKQLGSVGQLVAPAAVVAPLAVAPQAAAAQSRRLAQALRAPEAKAAQKKVADAVVSHPKVAVVFPWR